jgi:hypothetical protein
MIFSGFQAFRIIAFGWPAIPLNPDLKKTGSFPEASPWTGRAAPAGPGGRTEDLVFMIFFGCGDEDR